MRLVTVLLLLTATACTSGAVPVESCGAPSQRCCVATGTDGVDLAGAEYVFACDYGHWCEHDDGGVAGICR